VGFFGFHLGDVHTGMAGCFPFLYFMVTLFGVSFDLRQYFGYFRGNFFVLFLHLLCQLFYHLLSIDILWG